MTSGFSRIHDPIQNKSFSYSFGERDELGLRGLLPWKQRPMNEELKVCMEQIMQKDSDLEKYIYLADLQDRDERLFYKFVETNIKMTMPLIYTPTVGLACQKFSHIRRRPRGFYVTPEDKGKIRSMLDNWPQTDVKVVVVTDGQRILGLGDLGANGMGIPIGKLSLYTACAKIATHECLPVMLDVGTNTEAFWEDSDYLGWPHARITGSDYDEIVEELVVALNHKFPGLLIQFEDFLTPNAVGLLERYRNRILCFNDDIQGTAAVSLAGIIASTRVTGTALNDLRILFLGAGSAATGIGELIATELVSNGMSRSEAYQRLWFVDSHGLITRTRDNLASHKLPFMQDVPDCDFEQALDKHRPHILIGATGRGGTFTEAIIRKMCDFNEIPVVFAQSNPTSRAECTAEQAYTWSDGKVIFVSGSPFDPFDWNGRTHITGQGNNAYIFPGVGLGALAAKATTIPESMFQVAAHAVANYVSDDDLSQGSLYPPLEEIQEVSVAIANDIVAEASRLGIAQADDLADPQAAVRASQWDPSY